VDAPSLTAATAQRTTNEQECVEAIISSRVSELRQLTPPQAVEHVVRSIRNNVSLDYDAGWRGFAIAYLLINYRKALHILRMLPARPWPRVTDVGCGSGAGALACVTLAAECKVPPETVTLLDRSREQVGFARACVDDAIAKLRLTMRTTTECTDIKGYAASEPQDLFLCSHVLSEQRSYTLDAVVTRLFAQLRPAGCLLAIERGDEEPWHGPHFPVPALAEHHAGHLLVHAPEHGGNGLDEREWLTGWYAAVQPENWMQDLVSRYFDAWARRDTASLALIFADDATYQEKPFDVPLNGLAAISAYWNERVRPQRDIHLIVRHITFGYLTAAVEWAASFSIDGRARQVNGVMTLAFNPALRRVRALHEVFRTNDATTP
jgi:SAM-dependent methyltransferase